MGKNETNQFKAEVDVAPYLEAKQKKLLKKAFIFKIISSSIFLFAFLFACFGLYAFLAQGKQIWGLILAGVLLIAGIVFSFFPKSMMKKAYANAKADYEKFFKDYETKAPFLLQEGKRTFSIIDKETKELYLYHDCQLAYKINLTDIADLKIDYQRVGKRDRLGKFPYYVPIIFIDRGGKEHVICLSNQYVTSQMYEMEADKKTLKYLGEQNDILAKKYIQSVKQAAGGSFLNAQPTKPAILAPDENIEKPAAPTPADHKLDTLASASVPSPEAEEKDQDTDKADASVSIDSPSDLSKPQE